MNKAIFAILALFFVAGCYRSSMNVPGITAEGLAPHPPSPRYAEIENEGKSLDYGYMLDNKSLDYQYAYQNKELDYMMSLQTFWPQYMLQMRLAWEACLDDHDEDTCREIHGNSGGWPYFMGGYYLPTYGMPYGYGAGMMTGMGMCPFASAEYCNAWMQTQLGMQQANFLGSTYNQGAASVAAYYPQHASAQAAVWSGDGDPDTAAEYKALLYDALEDNEKKDETIKKQQEALNDAKELLE